MSRSGNGPMRRWIGCCRSRRSGRRLKPMLEAKARATHILEWRTRMKLMTRIFSFLLAATAVFAQYKAQPAGDPPSEAAAPILGTLSKAGTKIVGDNGSQYVEIWLRSTMPSGPSTGESSVTLPTIPPGTLLGVVRFPAKGGDRRGQNIAAGVYTLRYGNY